MPEPVVRVLSPNPRPNKSAATAIQETRLPTSHCPDKFFWAVAGLGLILYGDDQTRGQVTTGVSNCPFYP